MPDDLAEALGENIPLSEMIASLRQELRVAMSAAKGDDRLRLSIEKVELELQIVVVRKDRGRAGVEFGVVSVNAGGEAGHAATHKFKLTLHAEDATGGAILVNAESETGPARRSGG